MVTLFKYRKDGEIRLGVAPKGAPVFASEDRKVLEDGGLTILTKDGKEAAFPSSGEDMEAAAAVRRIKG